MARKGTLNAKKVGFRVLLPDTGIANLHTAFLTNTERILATIVGNPGISDSELSNVTGVRPHQQVNQICRRLLAAGAVRRTHRADGRIGNFSTQFHPASELSPVVPSTTGGWRPEALNAERLELVMTIREPRSRADVATSQELRQYGFSHCWVTPKRLGICWENPLGLRPFCRLNVEDTAPESPGVYVWTVQGRVMYVGKAAVLRQIVHGVRMGRAYNDYSYIPASKVSQTHSPRVRVGLLNAALTDGEVVAWWWKAFVSDAEARRQEAKFINSWNPPWNRAKPTAV